MEHKNPHIHHRQRLYALTEKVGVENLTDIQALELLLTYVIPRKDTNETAHALLDEFGTFARVLDAPLPALERVRGVGHRTAQMLTFIKGFFFRYRTSASKKETVCFSSKKTMFDFVSKYLQDSKNEQLYIFGLNSKLEVTKVSKLAEGDETNVIVSPRSLIDFISAHSPHAVVIAHSHGNNPANPSDSDVAATNRMATILHASNVEFYDCLIVSNTEVFGFLDHGLLNK